MILRTLARRDGRVGFGTIKTFGQVYLSLTIGYARLWRDTKTRFRRRERQRLTMGAVEGAPPVFWH